MRYRTRVAIISGAGDGIGRATALRLASEGAALVVTDIVESAAASTVAAIEEAGGRAAASVGTVTSEADCNAAIGLALERFGAVDVLVNNAAMADEPTFADTTPDGWDREFGVTLRGAFLFARAVLPHMLERGSGAIVNIGSVNGLMALGDPAYSAGKAGMISLTRSLAMELGRYGIRCNIVCPGTVRTPIWQHRIDRDPNVLKRLERWYPLGRIVEPIEVMRAVAFLASDAASAITGVVLPVDCGLTAGNLVMTSELVLEDF
jgi:NAD(P)-dependent dehydrogenase (short-subunit alcohol dehydrogenase family)